LQEQSDEWLPQNCNEEQEEKRGKKGIDQKGIPSEVAQLKDAQHSGGCFGNTPHQPMQP